MPISDNFVPHFETFNDKKPIEKQTGFGEAIGASFELAQLDTVIPAVRRSLDVVYSESDSDVTDFRILNDKYKPDVDFIENMSESKARTIVDYQQKRRYLEQVANSGPEGVLTSVGTTLASFAGYAVDPVAVAGGFVVGGLFRMAASAKTLASALYGNNFARGAIEGVVSNVLTEGLAIAPNIDIEQRDVSMAQLFSNAVIGGMAFPIMFKAGAAAKFAVKGKSASKLLSDIELGPNLDGLSFQEMTKAIELTEAKMRNDRMPLLSQEEVFLIQGKTRELSAHQLNQLETSKLFWDKRLELGEIGADEMVKDLELQIVSKKSEVDLINKADMDQNSIKKKANSEESLTSNDPKAKQSIIENEKAELEPALAKATKSLEEATDPLQVPEQSRESFKTQADEIATKATKQAEEMDTLYKKVDDCLNK